MGPGVHQDLCIAGSDWEGAVERCGIIFGALDAEGVGWIAGCAELENAAPDPAHAYAFEESAQLKAWSRVERWGYVVLGIWHTHPAGPEGPSSTDLAYAQPWMCYPVLWPSQVEGEPCSVGVYVLDPDTPEGYVTIPYEVVEEAGVVAQQVAAQGAIAAQRERFGMPEPLGRNEQA